MKGLLWLIVGEILAYEKVIVYKNLEDKSHGNQGRGRQNKQITFGPQSLLRIRPMVAS